MLHNIPNSNKLKDLLLNIICTFIGITMKKKLGLSIAIVLIGSLIGTICVSTGEQSKKISPKETKQVVQNIQQQKENNYKDYFVPLVPIISVIFASFGGAFINYYYWKKREDVTRKNKVFEEKIRSYLNLCKNLLEFNACTDLIIRAVGEQEELSEKENRSNEEESRFQNLSQIISDYEMKRVDSLKGLSQEINYAKIFFEDKVYKSIQIYLGLYDKIRTRETEWGPEAFSNLFTAGKNLQLFMEKELGKEIQKNSSDLIKGGDRNAKE